MAFVRVNNVYECMSVLFSILFLLLEFCGLCVWDFSLPENIIVTVAVGLIMKWNAKPSQRINSIKNYRGARAKMKYSANKLEEFFLAWQSAWIKKRKWSFYKYFVGISNKKFVLCSFVYSMIIYIFCAQQWMMI